MTYKEAKDKIEGQMMSEERSSNTSGYSLDWCVYFVH